MHCFAVTCLPCSSCWCGQECICGVTRSVFMLCCNVAETATLQHSIVLNADATCWASATSLVCRGHVCKYCNCNTVWQQTSTEQAIQLFLYCPACCWHLYRKKQTATIFKLHRSCALPPYLCWDENLSTPPKVWCYLFVRRCLCRCHQLSAGLHVGNSGGCFGPACVHCAAHIQQACWGRSVQTCAGLHFVAHGVQTWSWDIYLSLHVRLILCIDCIEETVMLYTYSLCCIRSCACCHAMAMVDVYLTSMLSASVTDLACHVLTCVKNHWLTFWWVAK